MTEAQNASEQPQPGEAPRAPKRPLHRVCIQCNNMFRVAAGNLDAKQCPNCHKG